MRTVEAVIGTSGVPTVSTSVAVRRGRKYVAGLTEPVPRPVRRGSSDPGVSTVGLNLMLRQ